MTEKYVSSVLLTMIVSMLAGCSGGSASPSDLPPLIPCTIVIRQDGDLLADASVMLFPLQGGSKWGAGGTTDSQGKAELYTNGRFKGAPEGRYKIVVSKIELEPSKLPAPPDKSSPSYQAWLEKAEAETKARISFVEKQYAAVESTPLEINIVKGATAEQTFDVGKRVSERVE